MSGKEISDIICTVGVFGWIPIYFFFSGIVKIVVAIKGKSKDKGNDIKKSDSEIIISWGCNSDKKNKKEKLKKEK